MVDYWKKLAIISGVLICITGSQASADDNPLASYLNDVKEDLLGVVTDPLKLKDSAETIYETVKLLMDRAERLEGKINDTLKARISQAANEADGIVKKIGNEFQEGVDLTDQAVKARVAQIAGEIRVVLDRVDLLRTTVQVMADCIPETATESLNEALSQMIGQLRQSNPGIAIDTIFGKKTILELNIDEPIYQRPSEKFILYEKILIAEMAEIGPDQPVEYLFLRYDNAAREARLTACHYQKEDSTLAFMMEKHDHYARIASEWKWISDRAT